MQMQQGTRTVHSSSAPLSLLADSGIAACRPGRVQKTLRFDRVSPISGCCTGCRCLSFAARRISWEKNSLVPICTKFISTTTRIQRLRPLLSGNDAYIKVKRMACLLDRSGFEIGRNFCAAQPLAKDAGKPSATPEHPNVATPSYPNNKPPFEISNIQANTTEDRPNPAIRM